MSAVIAIGTAVPPYKMAQNEVCEFMSNLYGSSETEQRKLRTLYERSGISYRYSVLPDYDQREKNRVLFPQSDNLEPFPSLEKRMELFNSFADTLAIKAVLDLQVENLEEKVTHLITVSCTGLSAPGLDLAVMEKLELPAHVHRTSVNFMGCYAAVHALKYADAICRSNPKAQVLVVSTELCTLHFQKILSPDNFTANALFGDGAAACLVVGEEVVHITPAPLRLVDFYSEVHHSGKSDMAWQLSSTGFLMTLSSYIPELIEANIDALISRALQQHNLKAEDIHQWAVHPGGRKILDVIGSRLKLPQGDLDVSYEVLDQFGNMSSATILFVMKKILDDSRVSGNIFGVAFGPGLTMETMLMKK